MTSRNLLPAAVAALVYCLFDADTALAWGPGIHIALASDILGNLAWLPAVTAGILTRYARDFLYGNIAADVVFAKRMSRVKQFCHHWSTGFAVLDAATDDRGRAFAYGYLCHLAADTVAHGKFIPHQIVVSNTTVNFGHLYWEMRADTYVGPAVWDKVDDVLNEPHHEHHGTLERLLTDTLLPFDTNRQLFYRINRIAGRRSWRRTMATWQQYSRHELPPELLDAYLAEAIQKMRSLLVSLHNSPVLLDDPNGTAALNFVRSHRRDLRKLKRRGLPSHYRVREAAASHAPSISPDRGLAATVTQ